MIGEGRSGRRARAVKSRSKKGTVVFRGVVLELPEGDVRQAHSRFTESSQGMTSVERLETMLDTGDFRRMSEGQREDTVNLFSVLHRNYQICNGGICQYYDNGYHRERGPRCEGDIPLGDESDQVEFLTGPMSDLANQVLSGKDIEDWRRFRALAERQLDGDLDPQCMREVEYRTDYPYEDEDYVAEEEALYARQEAYDHEYFQVNRVFEWLAEVYAQYIVKWYAGGTSQ